MVSPNDDDLMSQVFASVQLPEVKWTNESHETHEVIRKTVTVNENGEQHIHTDHYHYNNHNGDEHESEDEHDHVKHSNSHGSHGNADEELVSQVFFNRPTVETFRVENGVPESDDASERSSSRMSHHSHHSHHSRHMSESDGNNGHHILARENEIENGHLNKKVLENVPHKSQQQDSIIAELKKHQTGHDESSSDDETLKGDDDDHTVGDRHEEMWHHEPHQEEHIVHYEMPPNEPPRDYASHRSSVAHSDHNVQQKNVEQTNYFNNYNHDNRSQRSNSVHSEASRHSYQVPPSHHSSHDSIPPYKPPPPPQQQPATRDSRASSTSTLRSDRNIRIVTNHTPPAAPPQPTYDNGYDADEPAHKGDPKGIHTYREYGTHGHRRSNASEVSSVDYNRESFTVGDIEYIQEKPKARERTATKQSSMNSNQKPPRLSHHDHYDHHQEQRYRTDTKQSGISQHHEAAKTAHHFNPVKRQSYTPRGVVGHFVPSIDDSPIAPVSHLADQYGGRSHANKALFFPQKHEEAEKIEHHHSRASSKRGSDASSVHSLKHFGNKDERSNTHHSQVSIGKGAHMRRASTDSVGTQHTAVVDKNPGKYDSVRVVKNVRSYKEFLDVWSQREIEEATEEGPIPHVEPIPRPRYSISARHVYPDSLKVVQQPKHRASLRSAALRPSEHFTEHSAPGKVDKATSYHNLHLIGDDDKSRHSTFIGGEDKSRRSTFVGGINEDKSRKSTFIGEQKSRHSTFVPIQEEDEITEVHHHHHYHINGGTENISKSRKSTLKQVDVEEHKHENENLHHHHHDNNDDDDYEVDIHHLRSVFETDNERVKSRRASMQSNASGKSFARIPIVPASHRQPYANGILHSRRRR